MIYGSGGGPRATRGKMVPAPEAGLIVSGRSRTTYPRFVPTAEYFAWRDRERRAPKRLDPEELKRENMCKELRQEVTSYCCSLCEKTARVHSADATVQPPPLGRGPVRGAGRAAERERGPGDQLATSTRSYQ